MEPLPVTRTSPMRKIIILFFIIGITGCGTPKYHLTTNPEMINSYHTKKTGEGPFFGPSETYHIQNKIILIPAEHATGQVMKNTIHLIQEKRYSQLEKYLTTVDKEDLYLPIANGLLKIYRKNYTAALADLKKNKRSDIQFLVDLLMVDCEYEITLGNTYELNYYVFLIKYQKILDTYQITDFYKSIINNRIKFIRYRI
jgi:hypothetical protein